MKDLPQGKSGQWSYGRAYNLLLTKAIEDALAIANTHTVHLFGRRNFGSTWRMWSTHKGDDLQENVEKFVRVVSLRSTRNEHNGYKRESGKWILVWINFSNLADSHLREIVENSTVNGLTIALISCGKRNDWPNGLFPIDCIRCRARAMHSHTFDAM